MRVLGAISGILLAFSGCTKISYSVTNRDLVRVPLDVTLFLRDDAPVTSEEARLVADLNEGRAVSHKLLTKLLIDRAETGVTDPARGKLGAVLARLDGALDRHAFKEALETRVASVASTPLRYNKKSGSIFDLVSEGRFQAYSGTLLFQIARRTALTGHAFRDEANLVLFSPGHVFSGYRSGSDVIGIEHTLLGRAEIRISSDALAKGRVRPMDANVWAVFEIFRGRLDVSTSEKRKRLVSAVLGQQAGGDVDDLAESLVEDIVIMAPEGDLELMFGDQPQDLASPDRYLSVRYRPAPVLVRGKIVFRVVELRLSPETSQPLDGETFEGMIQRQLAEQIRRVGISGRQPLIPMTCKTLHCENPELAQMLAAEHPPEGFLSAGGVEAVPAVDPDVQDSLFSFSGFGGLTLNLPVNEVFGGGLKVVVAYTDRRTFSELAARFGSGRKISGR